MSYHITTQVDLPFDKAVTETREALARHGFGVLTQIDVRETLKNKIGADFRPYLILGACNPNMAHQALQMEDKVGTMLPCNVVVQQTPNGMVEVSAIDPVASMQAIDNRELAAVAKRVQAMLAEVVDEVRSGAARAKKA
jgi:uncharacterized protein (DUF302 family)